MRQNKFSELIFAERDLVDLLMQDPTRTLDRVIVDQTVNLDKLQLLDKVPALVQHNTNEEQTTVEFDIKCQSNWHMPDKYKQLDIANYILHLCKNDEELQRCGQELLLYQEHNLFDLLRYLHYLVQVMSEHKIIWGVGRGSSVASYVLYLLKVHKIDSLYYDLDPTEFLR